MPVKKGEPKQKVDARKKRKADIKAIERKMKALVKKAAVVKKVLTMDAKGIAWGLAKTAAKKAAKPIRKVAGKTDRAATKAVKGLIGLGRR